MKQPSASQIERTVRAVVQAGLAVRSVRVTAAGDILVETGANDPAPSSSAYDLVDFSAK